MEVQGKVVWVSLLLHAGIDPQVEVDQGVDLEGKLDLEILCESLQKHMSLILSYSRDWRFPQVNFQFKVLGIFFFLGHFLVELLYLGLGHYLLSGLDLVNWNHELLGLFLVIKRTLLCYRLGRIEMTYKPAHLARILDEIRHTS